MKKAQNKNAKNTQNCSNNAKNSKAKSNNGAKDCD